MAAVGWYLLPSGQPFHGTVPPGVTECDAPGVEVPAGRKRTKKPVKPAEDQGTVPAEVPGDQLGPDPEQVVTPPHDEDATG